MMFSPLEVVLLGLGAFVLASLFMFLIVFVYPKVKYASFPGPKPSYLLGNIHLFGNRPGKTHHVLRELQQKYGKTYQLWTFHRRSIVVTDPEDVRLILGVQKFPKSHIFNSEFSPMGGSGLLTVSDDRHAAQRRAIAVGFNEAFLRHLHQHIEQACIDFCALMDQAAQAQTTVDFDKVITNFTLDVILRTAFGADIRIQTDDKHPLPDAIATALSEIYKNIGLHPFRTKLVKQDKLMTACHIISEYCQEMIDKRRKESPEEKEKRTRDLLDIFFTIPDATDDYMIQEITTFLIAGHDTTSHTLSFLVYEVCCHKDIEDKMIQEVESLMEDCDTIMPPFESISQIEYTRMVWQEALRKYPVAATGTMRNSTCDVTLPTTKAFIPKNTTIIIPPYVMHRDPDLYPEPLEFIPERFDKGKKNFHPFAFQAFSSGIRNCIGQFFATHEALTVLMMLYNRYKIQLACKADDVTEHHATTMKPRTQTADGKRDALPVLFTMK